MKVGVFMDEQTNTYSVEEFNDARVAAILEEVFDSLTERNYNASSQLVGYLMSGDPGYISSYQGARTKITSIDRSLIIDYLLRKSLEKIK
jgi:uncharacterized protein (UPF0297 family)